MGIFLNRGKNAFERALNSEIYVDKTDMLAFLNKRVNSEGSCVCVTRPRRFGKTLAANMVAAYYDRSVDSRELFGSRKLGTLPGWDRCLNKFDVLRIDLAELMDRRGSATAALSAVEQGIRKDLTEAYPDIRLSEEDGVADMLDQVCQKTGIQFVIIIDEWDCIFRENKEDKEVQKACISLYRSLFKDISSKDFLALGYITGILPIKRYNSESALNNFWEFSMLHPGPMAPWIGFTMEDVQALCEQYQMDPHEAMDWYDGYDMDGFCHICSADSIVQAMITRKFRSYWSQTSAYAGLSEYITMDFKGLKEAVTLMLSGQRVPVDVGSFNNDMGAFRNKDEIMTVLIHLGYLGYDGHTGEAYIPNREARDAFEHSLRETDWDDINQMMLDSKRLLQMTLAGHSDEVAEALDRCHRENTSILQFNDENALACVISLAYYAARANYDIFREIPAGYGYADLVFIPRKNVCTPALVVELKWDQSANTAIRQIKEKHYPDCLKGREGSILLVGISYEKNGPDAKRHRCVIEKA